MYKFELLVKWPIIRQGYMVYHRALIKLHEDSVDLDTLIEQISNLGGYPVGGYGLYAPKNMHSTTKHGEYIVEWCTGSSCD